MNKKIIEFFKPRIIKLIFVIDVHYILNLKIVLT